MEQKERLMKMKAALVDFLARAKKIPHLEKIVLFGSLLEGDVNKKSDIDLLLVFNCRHNPETGEELEKAVHLGGEITASYNLENSFGFVIANRYDLKETDQEFLRKVLSSGVIVWQEGGIFKKGEHPELKPLTLIKFSPKDLSSANQRRLQRKLYGYQGRKGFLSTRGERIEKGVILIGGEEAKDIENLLKSFKVKYKKYSFWH